MTLDASWIDRGVEPESPPDPAHPKGIDLDVSGGFAARVCKTALPYPARRCGYYVVTCGTCGWQGIATTAGRADDPRSITVACK